MVRRWKDDDPTVFEMTIAARLQGDFQITNGYGPTKAAQVMKDHWSSFIVEDDFKFIARNGLNAVRIPVGWWIASDPTPPWPSNCSIECLDRHFLYTKNPSLYAVELLNEPLSLQV
ncbi:probable glucan 1,3-beta-glucosidase A [Medicago truncatula]|uniref:probable glucan 1,3-beta-glucosidase A n=1 Tax=Medicago truncatula TaxID=3880 RepID=UPI0019679D14|nr:probable glucan 1,3-beta-glucosidase A [Medicago truncatula]